MCLASVLWTMSPVVLALFAVAVVVHHKVIVAEEAYLTSEFGEAWGQDSSRVRRYV
jgi:protein-S-isoprenylcysteine O-methyltransferase Ste14